MSVPARGGHSVMAQRVEPHDSLDDFPTPPWAARALLSIVLKDERKETAWEPAANRGHMVRVLKERFKRVHSSDVHDYGIGSEIRDFLFPTTPGARADWIITNPPFKLFSQFAMTAWERANIGAAMFGRIQVLEGIERWRTLYRPLDGLLSWHQFVERVPIVKGRLDAKASTATAYGWLILRKVGMKRGIFFDHIPPCRRALERPGDYHSEET